MIDTSSSTNAIATIDPEKGTVSEMFMPARSPELIPALRGMAGLNKITRVAVATGPGSFTGLRVGVSFGLGLAMGLKIPIVPLPSLELQAARSDTPVTAVTEAGRGRVYYLSPARESGIAGPADLPREWPVVGWLRPETRAGLRMKPDEELRGFGEAAARLLETAREVAYGSLKVQYMQSFSTRS